MLILYKLKRLLCVKKIEISAVRKILKAACLAPTVLPRPNPCSGGWCEHERNLLAHIGVIWCIAPTRLAGVKVFLINCSMTEYAHGLRLDGLWSVPRLCSSRLYSLPDRRMFSNMALKSINGSSFLLLCPYKAYLDRLLIRLSATPFFFSFFYSLTVKSLSHWGILSSGLMQVFSNPPSVVQKVASCLDAWYIESVWTFQPRLIRNKGKMNFVRFILSQVAGHVNGARWTQLAGHIQEYIWACW